MVALNPDFAASKSNTDTKNHVGRFFSLATESVGEDSRSSRKYTGKKQGYGYDTTSVDTEFEYGPFGELIRATGEKKDDFNFRFSTKYEDSQTGLLYYGYRYYNAEAGRWLNRDPIEEQGGLNLYGMVENDLISFVDFLGNLKLTYQDVDFAISGSRPAMARLIRTSSKKWKISHYKNRSNLFSNELLIALFWLESKFDTNAQSNVAYGIGQMTDIAAQELNRYTKSGPNYPIDHHNEIVQGIGLESANSFRNRNFMELIYSSFAEEQISATIWFLSTISRRDETNDLGIILETYGPMDAPRSEYADVILSAEKCLQEATEVDGNGVPKRLDDACNCLEMADINRKKARSENGR